MLSSEFRVPELGEIADALMSIMAKVLPQMRQSSIELAHLFVFVVFMIVFLVFMIMFALVLIFCPDWSPVYIVVLCLAWMFLKDQMEKMLRHWPRAPNEGYFLVQDNDILPDMTHASGTEQEATAPERSSKYYMSLNPKTGYLIRTDCLDQAAKFHMKDNGTGIFKFQFAHGTPGRYGGYGLSASGSCGLGAYKDSAGWRFMPGKFMGTRQAEFKAMQCCDIIGTCASKDKCVNMLSSTDKTIYCNDEDRTHTCEVKVHKCAPDLVILEIAKMKQQ
jgi:hypothetical protein